MDPEFWLQRWQKSEIGFHSADVQPALVKHWQTLNLEKGERVFVPLCGKSLDMVWLEEQGYSVVGSELSEIAVRDFFAERSIVPHARNAGQFRIFEGGACEVWCGDFFDLAARDINATAAYDRAALVAMPSHIQARYADKLAELLPAGARVLLVGLDYDPKEMQGPPFNISQDRVRALFERHFSVNVLEARDGMTKSEHLKKRGITWLEEATYLLVRI